MPAAHLARHLCNIQQQGTGRQGSAQLAVKGVNQPARRTGNLSFKMTE